MLNRSLRESYPPGSTFKVITAAAALSDGDTPDTEVYAPRALSFDDIDYTLPNQGGASCAADETTTIEDALRVSCNTAFANLGVELGARTMREQAEKFGFNSTVDIPMTSAVSTFPGDPAEAPEDFDPDSLNDPQLAQSSIGQLNVRATPLQMAMVAAGIANDGVVMKPYVVQETRAPDLTPLETTQPRGRFGGGDVRGGGSAAGHDGHVVEEAPAATPRSRA
jgi:peptidoglycan glycosyltransferase